MSENRTKAREALKTSQRSLVDAADNLTTCQVKLSESGYDEWNDLLTHIVSEMRGEVDLLQATLDREAEGTDDAK